MLASLASPFESIPPVWELRVGEYRVFYDTDEESEKVFVGVICRNPPGVMTDEILWRR
jgi:hypothetical protein